MNTFKFYRLNGEQQIDAITKISVLNKEQNIIQVYSEDAISKEIEQGYDVDADFIFYPINDDQVEVTIREFVC